MGYTSIPVKYDTKGKLSDLDAKDGRDWDTFLRREVLGENMDEDPAFPYGTVSTQLFEHSERIEAIEGAVEATNGIELTNPETREGFEVGDWLKYNVIPMENSINGETEYYHVVDFSEVPIEYGEQTLPGRMMVHLQKQLNYRGYFIQSVDFVDEEFIIQHTDLILRRQEASWDE